MIEKLQKLIDQYKIDFPEAENPLNFTKQFGFLLIIEMLENRNGKQIGYVEDDIEADDGGKLIYI